MNRRNVLIKLAPLYLCILGVFFVTAVLGGNLSTLTVRNQNIMPNTCIIIDAGHGLPDGGATSCTGSLESDINLQIAEKLDNLLHLLGYKTLMLRTDENAIYSDGNSIAAKKVSDVKNRVKLVNNAQNALLVSIHQNYFTDKRYSGTQVFYAQTDGSDVLAKSVQDAIRKHINPNNTRQIKQISGVYLMNHINCTGILIECGFLSNPEESILLEKNDYQNNLCSVVCTTLGRYINTNFVIS